MYFLDAHTKQAVKNTFVFKTIMIFEEYYIEIICSIFISRKMSNPKEEEKKNEKSREKKERERRNRKTEEIWEKRIELRQGKVKEKNN